MIELLNNQIRKCNKILILTDTYSEKASSYLYDNICDIKKECFNINVLKNFLPKEDKDIIINSIIDKKYIWMENHTTCYPKILYSADIVIIVRDNKLSILKCRFEIDRDRYSNIDISLF